MAGLQNGGGSQGMNNLTTLIKRLEAATSRLEDIAQSATTFEQQQQQHHQPVNGSIPGDGTAAAAAVPLGSKGGSREASVSTVKEVLPPAIEDMDALIHDHVKKFRDASEGIDPLVEEQASSVAKAFADQRRFLVVSTKAKKPEQTSKSFMELFIDLQQDMGAVGDIRENYRGSTVKDQLSMVGEGIGSLQWLVMDGQPADYVGEVIGGAQMYGNRVLKQHKESDQKQVKYVQTYYGLLKALQVYIKKHYPKGVTWNNDGTDDVMAAYREAGTGGVSSANGMKSASSSGGPPPPPPPPPLPNFDNGAPPPPPPPGAPPANKAAGGDMGAVFDQLNRGEAVTSGLKKVDKSQMTHKNPSLRAGSTVPDKDAAEIARTRSPGPEIKPKPQSMRQNSTTSARGISTSATSGKPALEPKKELDGNKWLVENFDSPGSPIELDVTLSQSILISRCKNTTIILHGKANAVSIDNSPRTQILVDTLVSSVDVIKCPGFAIQVTGALPTILLDHVDGASIYLGKESLHTEIFTSHSSSVNIVLPPKTESEDSTEHPLPEQIRTYIKDGKVVSEIVEHAG